MKTKLLLFAATVFTALSLQAQTPDPNFFIYLCFGQSNMEAGATPADQEPLLPIRIRIGTTPVSSLYRPWICRVTTA